MPKAVWNGAVLAESDRTIKVEGNDYFPPDAVRREYFANSAKHTTCHWKGLASYYDIGDARRAAWSYQNAWTEVTRISGLVSFEPDIVAVHLDGIRLRLEPGQIVVSHGVDRDLTVGEIAGTTTMTPIAGAPERPQPSRPQTDPAIRGQRRAH